MGNLVQLASLFKHRVNDLSNKWRFPFTVRANVDVVYQLVAVRINRVNIAFVLVAR